MSGRNGDLQEAIVTLGFPELPKSWRWATIGELGEVRLGRQRSPKNRSNKFPTKYIRAANLTWNGLDMSDVLDMEFTPNERETYRLRSGDVILAEASGSPDEVGKPAVWNDELDLCCFQNTVIRFRPRVPTPKFAYFLFSHYARNGIFTRSGKGVGIHHLSAARFSTIPFPVAPETEQRRIVAKIEELFSDLDAGVAALARAKANLKRYRAAVLKAAVEGKLTAAWRAEHVCSPAFRRTDRQPTADPGTSMEEGRLKAELQTGADLLQRILHARRQKWEQQQLAKYDEKGKEH